MKVRDSGMPEREYWESLLDVTAILDVLGVDCAIKDAAEIGCGYGTFTIPLAQRISGTVQTFDIDVSMAEMTCARLKAAGIANAEVTVT